MRIYNRYILALVAVACFINILLAFLGQNDISNYFIINTVCFLGITFLFSYLNPRARKTLNTVGVVFFAGFAVIVTIEFIRIITG
ncbi:MAG: hypothetical protein JW712_02505 [Dehalococcoidales bacterium]|nr:hypothetical protein [Dehalococcoidales bacterium]